MSANGDDDSAKLSRLMPAAVAVVILALALVVWLLLRDGESAGSAPTPGGTATNTASPGVAPRPGAESPSTQLPSDPATGPTKPTEQLKPKRVGLTAPAALGNGVTVNITDVESVKGEARGLGQVAGPAVRLTVKVVNDTKQPVSLDLALMNVYFGSDTVPAGELSGPGVRALPATVAAGDTATGRYVFAVPRDGRERLRVDFTYSTDAPKAIFTGAADG